MKSYLLAIFSSGGYALWAIFAYLAIVTFLAVSFIITQFAIVALSLVLTVMLMVVRREKFRPEKGVLKYGALQGLAWSAGTMVYFYEFHNAAAFPLTTAAASLSLILFAWFIRKTNNSREGFIYFTATIAAAVGIFLQAYAVYGAGFSLGTSYLLLLPLIAVFYAVGTLFEYRPMHENDSPMSVAVVMWVFYTIFIALATTVLGGWDTVGRITAAYVGYIVAAAVVVVLAFLAELYSFEIARKAEAAVIDTINIITTVDFGTLAFSLIFLVNLKLPLFAGGALLIAALVLLTKIGGRE